MTHSAFESKEIAPQLLSLPELAERWRAAAENGSLMPLQQGRYTAVLDPQLAGDVRAALPGVAAYNYDSGNDAIHLI